MTQIDEDRLAAIERELEELKGRQVTNTFAFLTPILSPESRARNAADEARRQAAIDAGMAAAAAGRRKYEKDAAKRARVSVAVHDLDERLKRERREHAERIAAMSSEWYELRQSFHGLMPQIMTGEYTEGDSATMRLLGGCP